MRSGTARNIVILLTFFFASIHFMSNAERNVTVSGRYRYYLSEEVPEKRGRAIAVEQAKLAALSDRFGTYIRSTTTNSSREDGNGLNDTFNLFSTADVAGIWVRTLDEHVERVVEGNDIVLEAYVRGEARERNIAAPCFEASVGRVDDSGQFIPADSFFDRKRFDLRFVSPEDGYVSVYASDGVNDACRLLPDPSCNLSQPVHIKRGEVYRFFFGNSKAPYAKELLNKTLNDPTAASTSSSFDSGYVSLTERPSFKQFAEAKVTEEFNRWQRKKEYETRGQYAERTSGDRRELKKKELFENARNEYINSYAPSSITGTLGNYDSDYKVYTISVDGLGDIFAQVPLADRSFFEDNWTGVEIVPTFDIVRNELKVVGCEYRLGDRTFVAPQIYNDMADSFSGMDFEASQIDLGDLLEKLKATQGNVTLGELSDYVTTKVKSQSLSKSGKRQIPSTAVSSTFKGDWRSKKVNLM